jgi:broad specificity phosphatase PhoE
MKLQQIYFVRHGESMANVDLKEYQLKPDHAIALTDLGHQQAESTGKFFAQYFEDMAKDLGELPHIRLWQSPYLRTRQTAEGILKHCQQHISSKREDTMLVEQQFGLFDGLTVKEQKQKYPIEYAHYSHNLTHQGKYWASFPQGESPFNVDTRTRHMQGTFARDAEKHNIEHIIVVSHGITTRVMTMRYLHQNYEFYDAERNPENGSIRLLSGEKGPWEDKGYIHIPS